MPQPYRGDGKQLEFIVAQLDEYPHFAVHIAKIATAWTLSEEAWGFFLAILLGIEAGAGMVMYHALTGTGAQRSVLNQVADEYLAPELREDFIAVMLATRRRASERNAVVHGMWFIDPSRPKALVLAPRNVLSATLGKGVGRAVRARLSGQTATVPETDYSAWRVYREADFVAIRDRIGALIGLQDALISKIRSHLGLQGELPPILQTLSD